MKVSFSSGQPSEPRVAAYAPRTVVAVAHRQFQFSRCPLWNGHHGTPTIAEERARDHCSVSFRFFAEPRFPRHRRVIAAKSVAIAANVSFTGGFARARPFIDFVLVVE